MMPEAFRLTEEEQELLKLAAESDAFIAMPMWKRIEIFLNANVEEAKDNIRGNISSVPQVAMNFTRIWQQREKLRDELIAFVKGPIKDRKDLLDQIEQARKAGQIYIEEGIRSNA